MIGITVASRIGIGDALQFSSLPENYFVATGKKLADLSRPWFFDHNPYVIRSDEKPEHVKELWNFPPQYEWPHPRTKEGYLRYRETIPGVYLSNAEIWASVFKVTATLNRPRLYRFEDFPYSKRDLIILHTEGRSHGDMPQHIIDHVIAKYGAPNLRTVGLRAYNPRIAHIHTPTLWDLAQVLSEAKMVIGMDSGPAWIAACFPDIIVKKVRTKPNPPELLRDWVPLEIFNIHSHWDDRCHQIYNVTEKDIGFTSSYKRI